MKDPVHSCDGLCKVECDPPAPGGASLADAMPMDPSANGTSKPARADQRFRAAPMMPMNAAPGVKTEQ